ncbi:MAG: gluconate 2-dehydrogenase subunit 3 family protein, partial [Bacteroidia bacterium]|nr:gluconate 2-dehydrogenase subunit 3 family protein [Bacteroidia bacterium]
MDRRELLKMVAALTGGIVIGGEVFLSGGCNTKDAGTTSSFSNDDIAFLDEVAETILPKTKTPGAKDAAVGTFMTVMVNDCYNEADQKIFHEGITKLKDAGKKKFDKDFISLSPEQKKELLVDLDKGIKDYQKKTDEYFDNLSTEQKRDMAVEKNLDGKDPKGEKL